MARRQGYIAEFKKRHPTVPSLHVDLGGYFTVPLDLEAPTQRRLVEAQNDWVIRAYDLMQIGALNISYRDLFQLNRTLATKAYRGQSARHPVLRQFISANIQPRSRAYVAPQPYLIQTVKSANMGNPLRIAFVGLTENGPSLQEPYRIEDPLTAARRVLPEVRVKSDVVIILGYLSLPVVEQLAAARLGINAILTAHQFPGVRPVMQFDQTLIAVCINEGKALGQLSIFVDQTESKIEFAHRYVLLDHTVNDDPKLAAILEESRKAIAATITTQ